jgi:hypothetical protein
VEREHYVKKMLVQPIRLGRVHLLRFVRPNARKIIKGTRGPFIQLNYSFLKDSIYVPKAKLNPVKST